MKFSQAVRRLFFRDIDTKLYQQHLMAIALEKQMALLMKSFETFNKELSSQTKIALSNYESIQFLNSEGGLKDPFIERIVVKYSV